MKLWTPKNTTLQGESVDAVASAFVTEGSTMVVLELVEDAGTSVVEVEGTSADTATGVVVVRTSVEGMSMVTVGVTGVEVTDVVSIVELDIGVVVVTTAAASIIGATTGSYPLRYPVTTQSNSTSEAFPPKLLTTK